jgi:hypothetical protein
VRIVGAAQLSRIGGSIRRIAVRELVVKRNLVKVRHVRDILQQAKYMQACSTSTGTTQLSERANGRSCSALVLAIRPQRFRRWVAELSKFDLNH